MNDNDENKKDLRKIPVEDGSSDNSRIADDGANNSSSASASDKTTDYKVLENLSDEEMIDLFVEGLMEENGIDPGEDPHENGIFIDLKRQLMSEIDRSLIAELPDDKLDEFNKMVEDGEKIDPAAVAQAVVDAKLDVSKITLVTMARFKELYLNGEISENEEDGEEGKNGGEIDKDGDE